MPIDQVMVCGSEAAAAGWRDLSVAPEPTLSAAPTFPRASRFSGVGRRELSGASRWELVGVRVRPGVEAENSALGGVIVPRAEWSSRLSSLSAEAKLRQKETFLSRLPLQEEAAPWSASCRLLLLLLLGISGGGAQESLLERMLPPQPEEPRPVQSLAVESLAVEDEHCFSLPVHLSLPSLGQLCLPEQGAGAGSVGGGVTERIVYPAFSTSASVHPAALTSAPV